MSFVKRLDLLFREIIDPHVMENFVRVKSYIDSMFTVVMGKDRANVMKAESSIIFPEITDTNTEVDMLRIPSIPAAPTVAPLESGSGYMVWDSGNSKLYVWTGSAWTAMN
jgi:hypothetical protein